MFSEEHLYSIALRKCQLIGDINFKKLVDNAGSAKEAWNTPKKNLSKIYGIGTETIKEIGNDNHLKFAENEINFCEKNEIKINLRHLGEFSPFLNECEDAPAILYQKGGVNNELKAISIVGTRNITEYGKNFIIEFLQEIKSRNIITISGLAIGTDAAVHELSIKNNIPTVAVLAHGFHTMYPSKNRKLSEKILENGGALFTEFNSTQKPDRENFIQRNRVIAGLSSTTIIVETAFGGGSISTATFANLYNRDVYALPGKITDKYSQGCNQLIFQNKAAIISTISNLIESIGLNDNFKIGELFPKSEIKLKLTEEQLSIYNLISIKPGISLDEISECKNTPAHKILPILLYLELSGVLKSFSGKQFQIV